MRSRGREIFRFPPNRALNLTGFELCRSLSLTLSRVSVAFQLHLCITRVACTYTAYRLDCCRSSRKRILLFQYLSAKNLLPTLNTSSMRRYGLSVGCKVQVPSLISDTSDRNYQSFAHLTKIDCKWNLTM